METIKLGDEFDSLRARASSKRWRVIKIDGDDIRLECVGVRVGLPPQVYVEHRRDDVPGKFLGWELGPSSLEYRIVHRDNLLRRSDYARAENGMQQTLGITL